MSSVFDERIKMILKMFHFLWLWDFCTSVRNQAQVWSNTTFLHLQEVVFFTHSHILSFKNSHGEHLDSWPAWLAAFQWQLDFCCNF